MGNYTQQQSLYIGNIGLPSLILVALCVIVFNHLHTSKPICCFTMGSPLNKGWGLGGSQSARSKPQRAWDSFLLQSSVPGSSTHQNPKCRNAKIFGRVLLHSCITFHDFKNSGTKNPDLLSSKIPKCRTPMHSAKAGSPTRTFRRFRVSDFATSRIRMQDSRLFNLQNPEMVNKV
jgi:hypothetical protein